MTRTVHVPYTVEQDEDGVWCAHAQLRPGVGANGEIVVVSDDGVGVTRRQLTGRGELTRKQQARAGIDAEIGSGALEVDGAFDCRALDAPTKPELYARERGQALCEQGIVTCSFGKRQGTARVILGRGRASGELRDIGDVCMECGPKRGIVLGVVEGFAKTRERSIEMD